MSGRNVVDCHDLAIVDNQRIPCGNLDAGDGDIIRRMKLDGRVRGGREFGDFEQHDFYLSSKSSGAGSPVWTCSLPSAGWTQSPSPSRGSGIFAGSIDHGVRIVLDSVAHFADVDVRVTLRAPLEAVEREAPGVAPEFVSFGDGEGPVGDALVDRHVGEVLRIRAVKARQHQPAVRLVRIGIAQEKEGGLERLGLRRLAERTVTLGQRLRACDIALAVPHVGMGGLEHNRATPPSNGQCPHSSDYTDSRRNLCELERAGSVYKVYGGFHATSLSTASAIPDVHGDHAADAGHRHRREYRDLQRRRGRAAQAAAVPAAGRARCGRALGRRV